jgi:hypothetical protein
MARINGIPIITASELKFCFLGKLIMAVTIFVTSSLWSSH